MGTAISAHRGLALAAAVALCLPSSVSAQFADGNRDKYLKEVGTAFVLERARLVDGTGAPARDDVTIVIQGGKIIHVGAPVRDPPPGAKRIDLSGQTVLPGLVMMHEHMNYFSGAYVWDSQPGSVPKLLLAAGVTTARTAGGEAPQVDLNLKRRIDSGQVPGPRLFVTGAYLNGEAGGFLGDTIVRTAEDGRAATAYWGSLGATSMKVYSSVPVEALRGAVEEANRRKMHVAGHLGDISCAAAVTAGIHTIEHGLTSCAKDFGIAHDAIGSFRYDPGSTEARTLITMLVAHKVTIVATPAATDFFEPSSDELSMFSADQRERYERSKNNPPPWMPSRKAMASWNKAHREFERDFIAAGGRLLIGADASDFGMVPGYANHNSLIALVRAGFDPLQVISIATRDGANFLGIGEQVGTVAEGKTADLLIVRGAPDQRMEDVRNVTYVFKDGLAYDAVKLREAAKGQLGQH